MGQGQERGTTMAKPLEAAVLGPNTCPACASRLWSQETPSPYPPLSWEQVLPRCPMSQLATLTLPSPGIGPVDPGRGTGAGLPPQALELCPPHCHEPWSWLQNPHDLTWGHLLQGNRAGQTSTASHTWPCLEWPVCIPSNAREPAGGQVGLSPSVPRVLTGHSLGTGRGRREGCGCRQAERCGVLTGTARLTLTTRCWPWSGLPPAGCSAPRPPAQARSSAVAPTAGQPSRSSPPVGTWNRVIPGPRGQPCPGPAPPTHPVFAVRQAVVTDLDRQVSREQTVPQSKVTGGWEGGVSRQCQVGAPETARGLGRLLPRVSSAQFGG